MGMEGTLAWPLERAVASFGDREALVHGDRRFTYVELGERVARLGDGLRALDLGIGSRLGVLSANHFRYLELALGGPRVGAVMNALNTRLSPGELAFIVDDSGIEVLACDGTNLEVAELLLERCPSLRQLVFLDGEAAPAGAVGYDELLGHGEAPPADIDASALAAIAYTGGTTGRPKGAMITHRNLLANAMHMLGALGFETADRYLHVPPMFHAADQQQIFALTWIGGTHVVVPGFDPEPVAAAIEAERISLTLMVPTMLNLFVNHPTAPGHDLSSLRLLMYGASPMPDALRARVREMFACDFAQLYGMTEASPVVTHLSPEDHRRGATGEEPYATRLRSAGAPVAGVQAEVRREDGTRAAVGEAGEVWVRGPNIMIGYWNRPEETAAALAGGWYHTGDMAYADEHGYLYVVDRTKDMIITGGENVYSTEVENVLHDHPAVMEAAVIGVPDERWGERVHAIVVVRTEVDVTDEELVAHCRASLAGFKAPRSIERHREALPKSGAGKLLKRDLRAPFWAGHERQI